MPKGSVRVGFCFNYSLVGIALWLRPGRPDIAIPLIRQPQEVQFGFARDYLQNPNGLNRLLAVCRTQDD